MGAATQAADVQSEHGRQGAAPARAHDDQHELDQDLAVQERSRALANQEANKATPAAPTNGVTAPAVALPGLKKTQAAPAGVVIAEAQLELAMLPPELRPTEGDPPATVGAQLLVDDTSLVVHIAVGVEHWVAKLSAEEVAVALVGRDGLKELGSAADFIRDLPVRIKKLGTRVRIPLWGQAPDESFVVIDLLRIVRSAGHGSLTGLVPVEARLNLGKVGGVQSFAGDQITAQQAVPGEPIGGWFEIPETPELRTALGGEESKQAGTVFGGAFYADGVLRLAVKPTAEAQTGIVAHVDLAYIAEKLKAFGEKVADWVLKLLAKIKSGTVDFLKMLAGKLRFELPEMPGNWFDFDLRLSLPRLFRGGGGGGFSFNFAGLLPSGFNFSFGGLSLGAMPKLSFPWLRAPRIGGFDVDWGKLGNFLPSFPSLSMPKLPHLNFGLHFGGGFKLGFGADLGLAWPELGDLSLGFTIDLEKILEKIVGAGKWLLKKMRQAGDFIQRWIHLGSDGVLRIFDKDRPDGPMLGFHLLRLLDGADATDLAPTELRWTEKEAGISVEMGEKHADKQDGDDPKGKTAPERPSGKPLTEKKDIVAPPSLSTVLALPPAAKVDVALYAQGDHVIVWSEAPSTMYSNGQAVRSSLNVRTLATAALSHWPAGKSKPPVNSFSLDSLTEGLEGLKVNFGLPSKVGVQGHAGKVSGHAMWKLEQLINASDFSALVPSELEIDVDGAGGVQLGKLSPPGPLIAGQRFDLHAPTLRHKLLQDPTGEVVWVGAHQKGDLVAVSLTKEEQGDEGALAQIHLQFLLRQLERLGNLGRRALEFLAEKLKLPQWQSSGGKKPDIFGLLKDLASHIANLAEKAWDFAKGLLRLTLDGIGSIGWDLHQLRGIGPDLDLSDLIPQFDFKLPALGGFDGFAIGFRDIGYFGLPTGLGFPLPNIGLKDLLRHLPNVKPDFDFNVNLTWLKGMTFGISIDVGNLFGGGDIGIGFQLPLDALLQKLQSLASWFSKLPKGDVGALTKYLHLGKDGVLRIFNPDKPSTRVGFDLKHLFDGVDAHDLVPVEMHADIERESDHKSLVEVSYGDAQVTERDKKDAQLANGKPGSAGKHEGAVLVEKPKGHRIEGGAIPAPPWLRDQLGVPPKARIHASLYLSGDDKSGQDVTLFATIDGSDRGVAVKIHVGELAKMVGSLGPVKAEGPIAIDMKASMAKGMLIVSFGNEKSQQLHGHAGWRIDNLIHDISLSSLVPDELVVEAKQGKLAMSNAINVSGLVEVADNPNLPGLDWAKRALGDAEHVKLFASADFHNSPRIAIASEKHPDGTRAGIELAADKDMVARIEQRAHDLAERAVNVANKALQKDRKAGKGDFRIHATAAGITVERGKEGTPQHMYATFRWQHLAALIGGDTENFIPDDLRVGTSSMALEIHAQPGSHERPANARAVETLHPLLKEPMLAVGFDNKQVIDFDLARSKVTGKEDERQEVRAIATLWEPDGDQVKEGREVALTLDLQALLAHLLPHKRAWKKKDEVKKASGSRVSASLDVTDTGIDMSAALHHTTQTGKHRDLEVQVGWSMAQVLDIVMHMQEGPRGILDVGAGSLIPEHIHGSFATDRFKVDFGNDGHGSKYNCLVTEVPGLPILLGAFLDDATLAQATLHLNLPSADEMKQRIKETTASGAMFIPIAGCSIGVPTSEPGKTKYYEISFSVTPAAFKPLLYAIPVAGEILKAVDMLLDVVSDPVGTAEALINTPEALLDMVESAPEVWGNMKKMGFKKLAMGLLLGKHPSVRQFVLANRIMKKMKAAGWKKPEPGQHPSPEWDEYPPGYLDWVASLDGETLKAAAELDELAQRSNIDIEPNYTIPPGGKVFSDDIKAQIDQLEHGFKDLSEARELEKAAQNNPLVKKVAENQTKEKAKSLKNHLHQVLESGVDSQIGSAAAEDKPHTSKQATVDDSMVNEATGLEPDEKQIAEAESLFGKDEKDGYVVLGAEGKAWIQTFAGLSTQQLGELLITGRTIAITKNQMKREVRIQGEAQKGFVRALYQKRLMAAGLKLSKTDDTQTDDAKLVAMQRGADVRAQQAAEDEEEAAAGRAEEELDAAGEGGEEEEGELEGNGAGAGGQGQDGKDTDGTAQESAGGGEVARKDEKEDDEQSLRDTLAPRPRDARDWVTFDTENGTVKINPDETKQSIGEYKLNGQPILLQDIQVTDFKVNGNGADQIFEYTLAVVYKGAATKDVATTFEYTFISRPGDKTAHTYGGAIHDITAYLKKLNAAVRIIGTTGTTTQDKRFQHEGWDIEVINATDVQPVNDEFADVILRLKFHKVPGGTGTVKTPSGPQVVHDGGEAPVELLLERDSE